MCSSSKLLRTYDGSLGWVFVVKYVLFANLCGTSIMDTHSDDPYVTLQGAESGSMRESLWAG